MKIMVNPICAFSWTFSQALPCEFEVETSLIYFDVGCFIYLFVFFAATNCTLNSK